MSLFDRLTRLLLPAETPIVDYPFVPSDVALYQRTAHADASALDAQTWDDMLLPQYSAQLARETSIFGQQELHRRLHADGGAVAASAVRVRTLARDAGLRERLHAACSGLRGADREVSESLFGAALPPAPRWRGLLPWLPLGLLLSVVLALVTGVVALWGVVVVLWMVLLAVQMHYHEAVEEWRRILATLQQMLRAHSLLAALDDPLTAGLRDDAAQAGKLNRKIGQSAAGNLPGMREYRDWLWQMNVRHYFDSREAVRSHLEFLRSSFQRVATLEADLALARHLAQTERYCWAEQGGAVTLERVVHPLLAQAEPLSFALAGRGAFISGQNGIGKSTLLRTVGLNLIVARAFCFCYAEQAVTPLLPVYSSMQSEDALEGGESLYIAELRRARELLALAERAPALFIIDEIFRGTNHLESISAATAVLHTLSQQGTVIVSSHNLVLAPLLEERLTPWCVSRVGDGLQVAPGVLRETNGIALLAARGFDAAISAKANRVFDWLSDYMAHPADCEGIRNSL
ncbi:MULTISPECIES: DNA mismatch repair protein MutS [unclassified Duganella]|uniref:MutS-related protein n=1 Tax=unclassified Duganella TaxID=2636909 RepID=UPI000E35671C|nr:MULTISPECIES: DNA mismatch repair protein MutS [unclassified Duganella]RFP08423.1 DNA mismatch repair protein MutS [Duganella sp. BJB475]RFP22618.1 DNA mismatch repair protein MutS [Duganella sp. BJB476]